MKGLTKKDEAFVRQVTREEVHRGGGYEAIERRVMSRIPDRIMDAHELAWQCVNRILDEAIMEATYGK